MLVGGCASTQERSPLQPFSNEPLTWHQCNTTGDLVPAECAWVEVPRDWSDSSGSRIIVAIRRVRAPGVSRGQLWALDGGPGFAGDAFLQPAFADVAANASLDLIIPTHRGVVGSALACPGVNITQKDQWPACVAALVDEWGPGADGFDSTSAARDVAHLMDRVPTAGDRFVFGGSYGSVWGQRLLQEKPSGIRRMWLDSIVDLEGSLERTDDHADAAVRTLLYACADIPACAAMFEGPPLDRAEAVIRAYPRGTGCGEAEGLTQAQLQTLMYEWLSGPPVYWALAMAAYARADRCLPADVTALKRAVAQLDGRTPAGAGATYNPVLNRHVLYRELYRFDVDVAERTAAQANLLATRRGDIPVAAQAAAFGPSWREPGTSTVAAAAATELVLLSGALDPLDPPEWAVRTARRWQATLISVPWAGHSVLRYLGTEPGQCGTRLLAGFLAGDRLSTDCVDAVTPPDFAGTTETTMNAAQKWFGGSLF